MMKKFTVFTTSLLLVISNAAFAANVVTIKNIHNPIIDEFQLKSSPHKPKAQSQNMPMASNPIPLNELRVVSEQVNPKSGVVHKRLQQYFHGLPVHGKQLLLHEKNDLSSPQTRGKLALDISDDIADKPVTGMSPEAVIEYFQSLFPYADINAKQHLSEIVFIDDEQQAHRAYRIEFLVEGKKPRRPVFIIDRESNAILQYQNKLAHVRQHVKARGYGGHVDHRYQYGVTPGYPALDITYFAGKCYLDNDNVMTVDLEHHTTKSESYIIHPPKPIQYYCRPNQFYSNRLSKDDNGAVAVENDAHYFGTVVYNMYHDWYGVSPVHGTLIMRVHYGVNYSNAFWDGMTMTFGDGDDSTFPFMSLEITGHEVSHGFTQHHSNLEYLDESGSVNESFSDMAGKAAEYYATGKVNWSIGEGVMREGEGVICEPGGQDAFRCMNDPHRSLNGFGINTVQEFPDLVEVAERVTEKIAIQRHMIDQIIMEIATETIDDYFKHGEILSEKRDYLIHQYSLFLKENFYDVIKMMIVSELKQGLIVHNGSGVFNRAFYLLSTSPGWDVRKAFDVMVNANVNYWQSTDNFADIGFGILQSAKELKYNTDDIVQVMHDIGLACHDDGCQVI